MGHERANCVTFPSVTGLLTFYILPSLMHSKMLSVKEYIIPNLIPPSSDEKTEAQASDLPKVRRPLSSRPENNHQMRITEQDRQKVNSVPCKHEPTGAPEAAPEAVSGGSAVAIFGKKGDSTWGPQTHRASSTSHCSC